MAKIALTLDEQEQTRLEQIVIDDDAEGALRFARELHRRLKPGGTHCDPSPLRTAGNVEQTLKKPRR